MIGVYEEKECLYSESNAPKMLDKLLRNGLIELPQPKHPKEIRISNGPRYCKYHMIISHPIEKCKPLKG